MRVRPAFLSIALYAGIMASNGAYGADGLARLSAAREAPCSTAISMYAALCADTTVPDSIRAAAFGFRADYAFAQREYETARDHYGKAATLDKKNGRYVFRSGLSFLANGDTTQAIKAFTEIAGGSDPVLSNEAKLMLGRVAYVRSDYTAAMEFYRKTGPFKSTNRWSIAALFGKFQCAQALGLPDSAALYEKQLSPYAKTLLEREDFVKIQGGAVAAKSETARGSAKPSIDDTAHKAVAVAAVDSAPFALQVGAFASEASALAMKKKLSSTLAEVRCVTAIVSAQIFYRVWVGNFRTREAAEKFGREELLLRGLVFRVVAK